ncbi:hypothetical protein ACO1O0_006991 [Amphichorda felina]
MKLKFDDIPVAKLTSWSAMAPPGEYLKSSEVPRDFLPQNGVPNFEGLQLFVASEDGLCDNCFAPEIPPSGRELYGWHLAAKAITAAHNLTFVGDFHVSDRYVVFQPSARERLRRLQIDLMKDCHERGLLDYRTHVSFMDMTAENQDFNYRSFSRFATLLKDSIDPNGVLSPGKSGIRKSGDKA